jgi:hypothetical protein
MTDLLRLRLHEISKRLAPRKITLDVSPEAEQWLCDVGYNPLYGGKSQFLLVYNLITRIVRASSSPQPRHQSQFVGSIVESSLERRYQR